MNILLVAATQTELDPILDRLSKEGSKLNFFEYRWHNHTITPLVTGIGAMMTAYAIGRHRSEELIDIAINVGLAGTYHPNGLLGETFLVENDRFADLGAKDNDGTFLSLVDLGLTDGNEYPMKKSLLQPYKIEKFNISLPTAKAITLNTTSGTESTIQHWKNLYNPDIETMEGAAFYYACGIQDIPCIQLRSISNHVIPRDKSSWQIPLALQNLTLSLFHFLESNQ